jgi:hypothetical protein
MSKQSYLIIIGLLSTVPLLLVAQTDSIYSYKFPQITEKETPKHSLGLGFMIHSYGMGFQATYSTQKNERVRTTWTIVLASIKNRKEARIQSLYRDQGGKNYIYGKTNYFYTLTVSKGIHYILFGRKRIGNAQVTTGLQGGLTIGILKPYYVEIAIPIGNNQATVETVPYNPAQHSYQDVVGEADYFLGFDKLSIIPGIRLQWLTGFDISVQPVFIRAVELGIQLDAFTQKVPLMGLHSLANQQFFVGGTVGFLIGNSW